VNYVSRIFVVLLLLGLTACGGLFQSSPNAVLGVPYVAQEEFNYCVPASIAMWRGYDGLSPMSQTQIWNAMGGAPCTGFDAAYGVRLFTSSGSDAIFDRVLSPTSSSRDGFYARQLTSIDRRVPVIVVVGFSQNHVGVINGGSYQYTASTDRYTWNTVLFHDPDPYAGPDQEWGSADWTAYTCGSFFSECGQVVSQYASDNWSSHLQGYGYKVELYDGEGCCNEEYRD
jgi:hypothetical protein